MISQFLQLLLNFTITYDYVYAIVES